jgi:hypothetical protein
MRNLFFDSETIGFHGLPIIFQYALDDGPVHIHEIWKRPIGETKELIREFVKHQVVAFNLAFDAFHVCKIYSIFDMLPDDLIPENCIDMIAHHEPQGRHGPCVKWESALDLLLYSRKGPMQALMQRDDIRIRKVPTCLAYRLAEELEKRVEIDGIYFARRNNPDDPHWSVFDVPNEDRTGVSTQFKDVVLKFYPAGGLKFLAEHVLGIQNPIKYDDIKIPDQYLPKELGFAPFALAISKGPDWVVTKKGKPAGHTWPALIQHHIEHWHNNENAREYSRRDVDYLRKLHAHWGFPAGNDDDSVLAAEVGAVRWRGFNVDLDGLKGLRDKALVIAKQAPTDPNRVRKFLREKMNDIEALAIRESTSKVKLMECADLRCDCTYGFTNERLEPKIDCIICHGSGRHPVADRADAVLEARKATKEVELYDKLLLARHFYASFKVIGALSSRMSGDSGLNPQGIKREGWVRRCFTLAALPYILCGGDFSSFEVTLADAAYNDLNLRNDLVNKVKIHAVMAAMIYPQFSYEDICDGYAVNDEFCLEKYGKTADDYCMDTYGVDHDRFVSMYTNGKQAVFALIYGGDASTIHRKLHIDLDLAQRAYDSFIARYPDIEKARQYILNMFCSMRQPGGLGTQVIWSEPEEKIESLLGFPRYFTLENKICKVLFELANDLPEDMQKLKVRVRRRDREQWACGAVCSALYGAAFQLQAAAMRAAANHVIQSSGAQITKSVQRRIWNIQPAGIGPFRVAVMNIHDELLAAVLPDYVEEVGNVVRVAVESFRDRIPLIGIGWKDHIHSWEETH